MRVLKELWFIITDGWKSRGEANPDHGNAQRRVLRESTFVVGGKAGASSSPRAITQALEATDRYDASFEGD